MRKSLHQDAAPLSAGPLRCQMLDFARLFCALLVILIHMGIEDKIGILPCVTNQAVPFFFLVSGFFFSRKLERSDSVLRDTWAYVRRIALVYAVWTLLWLPYILTDVLDVHPGESTLYYVLVVLRRVLLAGTTPYWYLLALLEGAVILAFVLRCRAYWLGWLLCIGGLLLKSIFLMELSTGLGGLIHRVFYLVFSWENNVIMRGFPMLFLGSVLARHERLIANRSRLLVGLLYLASIPAAFLAFHLCGTPFWLPVGELEAFLLMCFCLVSANRQLGVSEGAARFARNLSSVIYLTHTIFLHALGYGLKIWSTPIRHCLTVAACTGMLLLLSKINWKPLNTIFLIKPAGRSAGKPPCPTGVDPARDASGKGTNDGTDDGTNERQSNAPGQRDRPGL